VSDAKQSTVVGIADAMAFFCARRQPTYKHFCRVLHIPTRCNSTQLTSTWWWVHPTYLATRPKRGCVANTLPPTCWARGLPPQGADWGCGERDTSERCDASRALTKQRALGHTSLARCRPGCCSSPIADMRMRA
jgi:hypothetical protein